MGPPWGKTTAPNERRQLLAVRGTGSGGSTYLTLLWLRTFPAQSRASNASAAIESATAQTNATQFTTPFSAQTYQVRVAHTFSGGIWATIVVPPLLLQQTRRRHTYRATCPSTSPLQAAKSSTSSALARAPATYRLRRWPMAGSSRRRYAIVFRLLRTGLASVTWLASPAKDVGAVNRSGQQ
jgi:hypothetical protein